MYYSRMSWAATPGRVPIGAQHGRMRFMRPKRASSANMMRNRRPRRRQAKNDHEQQRHRADLYYAMCQRPDAAKTPTLLDELGKGES
jgi:hypothetical protein